MTFFQWIRVFSITIIAALCARFPLCHIYFLLADMPSTDTIRDFQKQDAEVPGTSWPDKIPTENCGKGPDGASLVSPLNWHWVETSAYRISSVKDPKWHTSPSSQLSLVMTFITDVQSAPTSFQFHFDITERSDCNNLNIDFFLTYCLWNMHDLSMPAWVLSEFTNSPISSTAKRHDWWVDWYLEFTLCLTSVLPGDGLVTCLV